MSLRLVRRDASKSLPLPSPLLARLFAGRGVTDASELDLSLGTLMSPDRMKGLQEAAGLLAQVVTSQGRILILGDFDADGATSCTLMVKGLRAMGAHHVDYLVPNRFEYGYGMTPEIVEAARRFLPDLIITVDNGISSLDGVRHAQSLGMKVLITDHHLPGAELPPADAIVNPNQPGCEFPSKNLAGVGVAFYLLSALRAALRQQNWFTLQALEVPNLADFLDLVALGTIADVVPLDHNNRVLVSEGIKRIRGGRSRPGLLALLRLMGVRRERIISRDLAFGVAPRLNAAGRLEDISVGIECLLTEDEDRANLLASQLDSLNRERRSIEGEMKEQAFDTSSDAGWVSSRDAVGVCLFHEDWHQGVVGIVASRVKDKVHRPVIAFARSSDTELKGSARSIRGLHVRDALDSIAARNPGLVIKFGGHAMAAGLSLTPDNLKRFAREFDLEARRWLSDADLEQQVLSDGELDVDISVPLVRKVQEAAPWGHGFPEPTFDGEFEILEQRIVGGKHVKLKLRPVRGGQTLDAIAFNHHGLIEGRYRRLAYRLDINEYRGRESAQLIVEATDLT